MKNKLKNKDLFDFEIEVLEKQLKSAEKKIEIVRLVLFFHNYENILVL